ncbi:MAG: hypothetical protein L0Z54_04065 [Thermoplasmata archaeon]|nr:hypothetical protein [Thermoplasmata archaeon]
MPTYRNEIDMVAQGWQKYRRAMAPADRAYLDRLLEMAMRHSHEGAYMASPEPTEPIFLSILVEMLREMDDLRRLARGVAPGRLDDE